MDVETQHPLLRERFYRRERRSVGAAREFTRSALTDWEAAARADEVLLCVSELATNAVVHGVPPGRGYRLQLRSYGDGLLRWKCTTAATAPRASRPWPGERKRMSPGGGWCSWRRWRTGGA